MKTEFTIEQIREFVAKDFPSVAARMTKSLLQLYDEATDTGLTGRAGANYGKEQGEAAGKTVVKDPETKQFKCACGYETDDVFAWGLHVEVCSKQKE